MSNLVHLGPPWKTLCAMSDSNVLVEGGQALIEFRSGSTTSPNLYNGFRASVEFQHSPTIPTTSSAKRTLPTTESTPTRNIPVVVVSKNSTISTGSGNSAERKSRMNNADKSVEEPLGYARANTGLDEIKLWKIVQSDSTFSSEISNVCRLDEQRPSKAAGVACGHVFDGNSVREEGFRLKIPKDFTSPGKKSSNSNTKKPSETFHCRLEFHGKSNDVIQVALSNYKLRYAFLFLSNMSTP